MKLFRTIAATAALLSASTLCFAGLKPLCEYQVSPIGVDESDPVFSWSLETSRTNVIQKAYRIKVYDGKTCVWDSGRVLSDESSCVHYAGHALRSATDYNWELRTWYKGEKSRTSAGMTFRTGLFCEEDWAGAKWIAYEPDKGRVGDQSGKFAHHYTPLDMQLSEKSFGDYKLPLFRTEFYLPSRPVSATAYVCGLGQFELYLNGEKVGDHFIDPGWTQYDKEVQYVAFDVLPYLNERNAVGVMLGNGFFNIPNERYYKICGSFGVPRLKARIHIVLDNGETVEVISDETWRTTPGPVTFSSVYRGENYDARLLPECWDIPTFDDGDWSRPLVIDNYSPVMRSQMNDPVKVVREMPVADSWAWKEGTMYDMGQNCSGIFRIQVRGKRGDVVRIWPSENLKDGDIYQLGTGGPTFYEYTLKGEGVETWQPRFSYYGQRYFYVEGNAETVSFTGLHTSADFEKAGSFSCSNELFNKSLRLVDWALRSNSASVFTDCPHREKLGWLEQTHLMFSSNTFMYKLPRIYHKILQDMATAQRPDGCIPTIAPEFVRFETGFEDTPEWGSALIIDSWYIYRRYGDDSYLRKYYPVMKSFVDYLRSRRDSDGIVAYGLNDWLTTDNSTSIGITSHVMYIYDLALMNNIAALFGDKADAALYDGWHKVAVDDFNARFWDDVNGIYDNDTQADNAAALYFGIVPQERLRIVADNLLRSIMASGWAVTTGEVIHPYMLSVLSSMGRDDVISRMHNQTERPGYAYILDHGATTLTEAWDGTLSQNHFANGHIVQWFYEGLAGIGQTEGSVAYRHLTIEPRTVDEVNWVNCSHETPYGKVVSNWSRRADGVHYHIEIPACCDAAVRLPGYKATLGSGSYDFVR